MSRGHESDDTLRLESPFPLRNEQVSRSATVSRGRGLSSRCAGSKVLHWADRNTPTGGRRYGACSSNRQTRGNAGTQSQCPPRVSRAGRTAAERKAARVPMTRICSRHLPCRVAPQCRLEVHSDRRAGRLNTVPGDGPRAQGVAPSRDFRVGRLGR